MLCSTGNRYVQICSLELNVAHIIVEALRAIITDGISIGCPCCGKHDCKNPLPSQRARFCEQHVAMDKICVVVNCDNEAHPGHRTCSDPDHRELEREGNEHHTALFQLRRRLEQSEHSLLDLEVEEDSTCTGKPEEGNTRIRAQFGRRRTHNEQLVVLACGIIVARATFFGSEAVNGVRVMLNSSLLMTFVDNLIVTPA